MIDGAQIVTQGAAAGGFAKILVDLLKLVAPSLKSWMLPILALLLSESCAFLLVATGDEPFTRQTIALTILVGIGATAAAIGVTQLQSSANRTEAREQIALTLPAGSDKSDVDKAITKAEAK